MAFPANVTSLPSPGIRMTAFALMISSVGVAPVMRLTAATWARAPAGREIAPKKLQNVSEWDRLADGDDLRIWPFPARRGCRNTVSRCRTDRAGPTSGCAAQAASGARGRPVSKDALIEAAWPGLAIEDSNLTVQIAALRRVFDEAGGGGAWIETMSRRGYRYIGPAVATGDSPTEAIPQISPLALPDKPSVAVLPFTNLSGDPRTRVFRRWHGRRHHRRIITHQMAVRGRAQFELYLQGDVRRREARRSRIGRALSCCREASVRRAAVSASPPR